MTTYQDFIHDSTPANKHLLKEFGAIRGLVASKIIYTCNLKDGVCRMGQRRKAEELGMDRSTVSKAEKFFIDEGYVSVEKEATKTEPPHLKPTEKLWNIVKAGDNITSEPLGGDDITSRGDLINQEEELKEEKITTTKAASKKSQPKQPQHYTFDELRKDPKLIDNLTVSDRLNIIGDICLAKFGLNLKQDEQAKERVLGNVSTYGADKVIMAIITAFMPERANGKPKNWAYIEAILKQRGQNERQTTNGSASKKSNTILTGAVLEQYERYERERLAKAAAVAS